MPTVIRPGELGNAVDAASCAAIYAPYVRDTIVSFETDPPDPREMAHRLATAADRHAWLVAEVAGRIVGYAYGHPFAERAAYRWACETSIYLDQAATGAGIGRALYSQLLERLTQRGYRTALAGISRPNPASEALHLRLGYREAGVYRRVGWKHGAWHDVVWYQRDLHPSDDEPTEPS